MWSKIKDRGLHLRTRPSVGAGGNGHGREHPPYLQALRNIEDEDRSSNSGEGKEGKIKLLGIEEIQNTPTSGERFKVEEKTQRADSPKKQWRMTMNKGQMQAALSKVSDTFAKLDEYNFKELLGNTAMFANMKLETPIDEWSLAIIMSAIADAKISIMPEKVESYRESMMWTAIAANLKEDKSKQLPRVNAEVEAALSSYNSALNAHPILEQTQ